MEFLRASDCVINSHTVPKVYIAQPPFQANLQEVLHKITYYVCG